MSSPARTPGGAGVCEVMSSIHYREAWLLAARELEENRNENLWQQCLEACSRDPNEARARYLNTAAERYDRHLAQGRSEGSPHPDGQGGIPKEGARGGRKGPPWRERLLEPSPFNPLIAAVPLALTAFWWTLVYILVQTRPPFMVWGGLLMLVYVPSAAVLGYALVFALRYRLSPAFRQRRAEEAEALAPWAMAALMAFGAISTYLLWAL